MQGYISYIIDETYNNYSKSGEKISNYNNYIGSANIYCMFYSMMKNIHIYNLHDHIYQTMNQVDFICSAQILKYKLDMTKIKEIVDHIYIALTDPTKLILISNYPDHYERKYIVDMIAKIICVKKSIDIENNMDDYLLTSTKEAECIYDKYVIVKN